METNMQTISSKAFYWTQVSEFSENIYWVLSALVDDVDEFVRIMIGRWIVAELVVNYGISNTILLEIP